MSAENNTPPSPSETVPILAKVILPNDSATRTLNLESKLDSTVLQLKDQIKAALESHPEPNSQRLIYQGRQLQDEIVLRTAFQLSLESQNPIALHVVVRPGQSSPISTTSTTTPRSTPLANRAAGPTTGLFGPPGTRLTPPRYESRRQPLFGAASSSRPQQPQGQPAGQPAGQSSSASPPPNGPVSYNEHRTEIRMMSQRVYQTQSGTWEQRTEQARTTVPPGGPSISDVTRILRGALEAGRNNNNGGTPSPNVDGSSQPQPETRTDASGSQPPSSQDPYSSPEGYTGRIGSIRIERTVQAVQVTARGRGLGDRNAPFNVNNQTGFTSAHSFGLPLNNNISPRSPAGVLMNYTASPSTQQQFWLLRGPDGSESVLVSPPVPLQPVTLPTLFPRPAPGHLSNIPSNLNSIPPAPTLNPVPPTPSLDSVPPAPINVEGPAPTQPVPPNDNQLPDDPHEREAMLRAQIEEVRRGNAQRLALLEEQRRAVLDLQLQQAEQVVAAAVPDHRPPQAFNPILAFIEVLSWLVGAGNANNIARGELNIARQLTWFYQMIMLIGKIVAIMWMFSTGGRDVRRDRVIQIFGLFLFLWQSGIFDYFFLPMARRINNMIPDPNRLVMLPPQQPAAQQEDAHDPRDLAQRLIEQHNNRQVGRVGAAVEAVQNSLSIFLASLIPGLGERIGNARAQEIERRRLAIEAAQWAAQGGIPPAGGAPPAFEQQQQFQAPGPQNQEVIDRAENIFGEDRARELFGPPREDEEEEVQPMFGL
ncbi:hypothetical protein ABW19_dt0208763 [Dactylella cylindrospora]|nr:hypothetical protein ABW19_dt0208763 [Dactylella cylindrospora]